MIPHPFDIVRSSTDPEKDYLQFKPDGLRPADVYIQMIRRGEHVGGVYLSPEVAEGMAAALIHHAAEVRTRNSAAEDQASTMAPAVGTSWADENEPRGQVILREKPRTELVDKQAYALPADATAQDYEGAADWVRFHGGEAKVVDAEGLLVVSRYRDETGHLTGETHHEWVQQGSLIVFDPEHPEFTVFGHAMLDHYLAEPTADGAT